MDPFEYLYARLDATDAMRVYEIAKPAEQDKVAHLLMRKFLTKFGASRADRAHVEMIRQYVEKNWQDIKPRLQGRADDTFYEAARVAFANLKKPAYPRTSDPAELERYADRTEDYRVWQRSVLEWMMDHQMEDEVWSDRVWQLWMAAGEPE